MLTPTPVNGGVNKRRISYPLLHANGAPVERHIAPKQDDGELFRLVHRVSGLFAGVGHAAGECATITCHNHLLHMK
jgi:hypothetical protein